MTHSNMLADISLFDHWMKLNRGKDVWLTAFPLFHMAGLMLSTLPLVFGASQVLIPNPRDIENVVGFFEKHQPNVVANVPSLTMMLLADERFKRLDFSALKYWISGAAPFPVEAIRAIEGIIGEGKVVEVWGMTETSPIITSNPARGPKKIGSVGLPLPNMDFKVVAVEDGYVYVVDRAKDMINVSGFKVFSAEVEGKFYDHPAIAMCALIGLVDPNRLGSEIVKLVVQKSAAYSDKPDSEVEADLIAYAREKMAPYKVPKIIEFVDALPMTSVGKVDKKVLRTRCC